MREGVTLTLYNTLGQAVRTLYSGTREAGRHQLSVSLDDLRPGMYLYRLTTGTQALTRVLHIMR